MSKRSRFPQSRHHILVYDEDWELLSEHFSPEGRHPIGPGAAIRELVHASCQKLRQKIADKQEGSSELTQSETAQAMHQGGLPDGAKA